MRIALIVLALALAGCCQQMKVVDGSHISLGAYLPYDGGIYGVNVIEYTSGCVVKGAPTNSYVEVQREYSSTNNWMFGLLETIEHSKIKIKIDKWLRIAPEAPE